MANEREKMARDMARYIAMAVRNAMEDFHCEHLSDDQMRELNPIIRNAIYTALYAASHTQEERWCAEYFRFQNQMIPQHWEAPRLTEEAIELRRLCDTTPDGQD